MSAKIIRFPSRSISVPDAEGPDRLRRALLALDSAVVAQRQALAEWREALGRLQSTMHGLGLSVMHYRERLDGVGRQVAGVNVRARALENWADGALTVVVNPD